MRVNFCCKKVINLVYLSIQALEKTMMSLSCSVQFSFNGVNADRSIILLNFKCILEEFRFNSFCRIRDSLWGIPMVQFRSAI